MAKPAISDPHFGPPQDPPWGPPRGAPPGGPPGGPGGPGAGGAPGGPPGPPRDPPGPHFRGFGRFPCPPSGNGKIGHFCHFRRFWGLFCEYLTWSGGVYSRRRLKMAIFGFWGEFGGSPGDPPKPPKNPIFANFRWVLNNSPSRDILNSLFGPFCPSKPLQRSQFSNVFIWFFGRKWPFLGSFL